MIDAVKDYGIFMLDPLGYVISWNGGAERISGYAAEEIIGRHFSTFYPPEALAREWPSYELTVAAREGRFEDLGWRIRKDGSRFWANVIITALRNPEGALIGYAKVTRDLTEQKEQEEALRRSERRLAQRNIELAQKNNDLRDFAHVASHDLQEPLRKVRVFSDLLEQEYADQIAGQGKQYIDRIQSSVERMSTLLTDLLSYSRVTSQVRPFEPVDLNQIIDTVLLDLHVRLEETDGRVERTFLPTIEADPTQMRQLFQNLIANALKFHRPNLPPLVQISASVIETAPEGRKIVFVRVQDNGIGFSEQYAERIFVPFKRLHSRREYEGTGLGLSICKRIVERHQGSLSAESRPNRGATFTIVLPVEQEKLPPVPELADA